MFNNLTSRFKDVLTSIGKKPSLQEKDLDNVLREIRIILLEADVALPVTREIISSLKEDLLGKEIYKSISPKQVVSKSLYDTIYNTLESTEDDSTLYSKGISYYMLIGLQGSGKTTTAAKMAYHLKQKEKKKVLLVSLDFNRPAAYSQLQTLSKQNDLEFFEYTNQDYKEIYKNISKYAEENNFNAVILDTAGRTTANDELIAEMQNIHSIYSPKEVLLVIDSSVGQISFDVANKFNKSIKITGIIASKADADSRGGAILSCKKVTGVPIKFVGNSEKINGLSTFSAKRITDRLLDQGDIISLAEQFEEIDQKETEKMQQRLEKGIFNFNDYKSQLKQMEKLSKGGGLLSMLPGMSGLQEKLAESGVVEETTKKSISIIDSMTKQERRNPVVLNFSRKKRIAKGSGTTLQDINVMMKHYNATAKMMKQFKGGGADDLMKKAQSGKLGMSDLMKVMKKVK